MRLKKIYLLTRNRKVTDRLGLKRVMGHEKPAEVLGSPRFLV